MSIYKNGLSVIDPKWAHPEIRDTWSGEPEGTSSAFFLSIINDTEKTPQERQDKLNSIFLSYVTDENTANGDIEITSYDVPGCPEEPDAMAKTIVYRKKGDNGKKRVLFSCIGGGLRTCLPQLFPNEEYCTRYDCTVVVPVFRTTLLAKYPAQVNDCHAVYKWMTDNAEMLNIDPDNVVICGASSGGHMATALPFRLMKYGYRPRGVVACNPLTDDRDLFAASRMRDIRWSGPEHRTVAKEVLGERYGEALLPPEAFANRATSEDCIGYPPLFIHAGEFDPGRDNARDFVGKVLEAGTHAELHIWAGTAHDISDGSDYMYACPFKERIQSIISGNVLDCFNYDLRRPWVKELGK